MNKKSVFAEFHFKISSSSLQTFYDNFWLIRHNGIDTLYLVQLINKWNTFLPKGISINLNI